MKNFRIYLLAIGALALSLGSFLSNGARTSQAQLLTPDVEVVNKPNKPVPVAVQGAISGTVSVNGTVAVSNFPATQPVSVTNFPNNQSIAVTNFPDTQSVVPAGTPITLQQSLGLNGPINPSEHIVLFNSVNGETNLNGQLALGSISIAATSFPGGEIILVFYATNCAGNGFGHLREVVIQAGSTTHLEFPTPQLIPAGGARTPFCIEADVLNGNHAHDIDINWVGTMR